jgi:hypothetical protein
VINLLIIFGVSIGSRVSISEFEDVFNGLNSAGGGIFSEIGFDRREHQWLQIKSFHTIQIIIGFYLI